MKKKKKVGQYTWSEEEVEYLIHNYEKTPTSVIAKELGRSKNAIATKAYTLKLTKDEMAIERSGGKQMVLKDKLEETPLTEDIICFYHRRGIKEEQIAKEICRPVEQVKDILNRCLNNGKYEYYARQENSGIRFDKESPLIINKGISGSKRGAVKNE